MLRRLIRLGVEFFGWWLGQIRSLAPWLPASGQRDALILDIEKFSAAAPALAGNVLARRGGSEEFVGALDQSFRLPPEAASLQAIGLRLPSAMALHRRLVLPEKAEHHLQAAIGFEMDRLTPFAAGEVFWSVYGVKREQRKLKLTLMVVPRAIVEPLLEMLARMQLAPAFIENGSGRIQLRQRGGKPASRSRLALSALCCALVLGIAGVPVIRQQQRMDRVDRQLQILAPDRQKLVFLRRELANLGMSRAIAAAARENGDALQILAMLTNALPDGTWLNALSLTPDQVILAGQSNDAARLISALAAMPGFRNPGFTGPITRAADGAELFTIHAAISKGDFEAK